VGQQTDQLLSDQAMTDSERAFAIQQLIEGRDAVLGAITGVSEEQARFKPRPDGWSIADCVEHIAITEDVLFGLLEKGAANPQGVALDPEKDGRFARAVVDRSRKVGAPELTKPVHAASAARRNRLLPLPVAAGAASGAARSADRRDQTGPRVSERLIRFHGIEESARGHHRNGLRVFRQV
jgi:DinB superfamily